MKNLPLCICGNNKYLLVLKNRIDGRNFSLYRCRKCGLIRTIPVPRKTTVTNTDIVNRLSNLALWESFAIKTIKRITKYKKYKKVRILDLGCNVGIFVKVACEQGFDAVGIEIDAYAVKMGKKEFKVDIRAVSLNEAKFVGKLFDCVIMNHTLEHVYKIKELFKEIRRILKNDGILVIDVPNIDSLPVKVQELRHELWYGYDFKHHVWHFTPLTLSNLLKEEGFNVLELTSESMYYEKTGKITGFIRDLILWISKSLNLADQIVVVAIPSK